MREYFLAVDGGGSKTEFCLYNCASGEAWRSLSGSSNYKIMEADAERTVFLEGVEHVFRERGIDAGQVRGLVMGMSGIDSQADYDHYLQIALCTGIPRERIYLCNDSELAFYTQGTPPGLCVIAGTGSVATGIAADKRTVRSGGWSNYISDEGSGGWIGVQVLRALLRYCDGYGTYEPVFDVLRSEFRAPSFEALPPILTRASIPEVAATARTVMELADGGDAYCAGLVQEAAVLVAEIAWSVYRKLGFEKENAVDVVMAGSLFKCVPYSRWFQAAMLERAAVKNLRFRDGAGSPVLGGITLAKLLFGEAGQWNPPIKIPKG